MQSAKLITTRRLGKDMAFYAVGTFLQRIASLLLVPLYTSILSTREYGALETLTVIIQTLTIVVNFGLSNALIRYYSECQDDNEVKLMVRTSSIMVGGLSFGVFLLILPFTKSIGVLLFKDSAYGNFIILTFLWAIGGALNQQLFAYYRARQDARTYVTISIAFFLILTTLNIAFVRYMDLKIFGVLLGNLIVVWLANLLLIRTFWRQTWTISIKWAKELLRFGFPLVFSMTGWLILNSADRYFLAYYRNLSEVGLYGLGYKVGLAVQMAVIAPFQLAWGPYMLNQAAQLKEKAKQDYSKILTYLVFVFSFVGLVIFEFAPEIVRILGSGKFPQAVKVVPFVILAYLFNGVYYWAASFFHLTKKTILISIICFSMAIVNLVLNRIWIPKLGWWGAAWSTLITIGGVGIISLIVQQRIYPVELEFRRLGKLFISVSIILLLYIIAPNFSLVWSWVWRVLLLFLLPIILLMIRFFNPPEIRFFASLPTLLKQKFLIATGKLI